MRSHDAVNALPHRICLDFPTREAAVAWFELHRRFFTIGDDTQIALFQQDGLDRIADAGGIPASRTFIVRARTSREHGLIA